MSITKAKAFLTSDGKVFLTQEEAQQHEIEILLVEESSTSPQNAETLSACIMKHRVELLAILSTRKPRTPKAKTAKVNKATRAAAVNAALQDAKQ